MRALSMLSCLVLLGASGCLEVDHTVTVAADGSGKQTLRVTIADTTLADVERAGAATQAAAPANVKAVFDEPQVRAELAAAGLDLTAHRTERVGTRRTVELTAAFPSFEVLRRSPLVGSRAEWTLAPGPKPGTAKLTLYPQGKTAWTEGRARAEAMRAQPDPVAEAFFQKRRQELAGLDLAVRFQVPGDVLVWTANMEKTGDREVTARVTAAQLETPQDLVRRLAPRFEVIFDATGCSLPLQ